MLKGTTYSYSHTLGEETEDDTARSRGPLLVNYRLYLIWSPFFQAFSFLFILWVYFFTSLSSINKTWMTIRCFLALVWHTDTDTLTCIQVHKCSEEMAMKASIEIKHCCLFQKTIKELKCCAGKECSFLADAFFPTPSTIMLVSVANYLQKKIWTQKESNWKISP